MQFSLLLLAGCITAASAGLVGKEEAIFLDMKLSNLKTVVRSLIGNNDEKAVLKLKDEGFAGIVDLRSQLPLEKKSFDKKIITQDPTPVIQMHGMGDFANDPFGMVPLAEAISDYLGGVYVLNVQIGDNSLEDILNGFLMNLDDQVDYFAKVVKDDPNLVKGFNAIGYSQGNLVVRGYIERYNNPPVFNFISMHGPLAGVGSFPGCSVDKNFCRLFSEFLGALAYYPGVQNHLAQANYFRDPMKIDQYLEGGIFLNDINNEVSPNPSYNENWASLNSVCLIKALGDTVVIPNESEWYGYFQDGSFDEVLGFNETSWYNKDLFGLKTLDQNGKVFFNTTTGDHLDFETDYLLDLVGIYFV